jgi:hypothetical protein
MEQQVQRVPRVVVRVQQELDPQVSQGLSALKVQRDQQEVAVEVAKVVQDTQVL